MIQILFQDERESHGRSRSNLLGPVALSSLSLFRHPLAQADPFLGLWDPTQNRVQVLQTYLQTQPGNLLLLTMYHGKGPLK